VVAGVDQPVNGQTVTVIGGVSVFVGPFAGLRLEFEPPIALDFASPTRFYGFGPNTSSIVIALIGPRFSERIPASIAF
jgi:hypothetical protein